jgi:hydroxylamine reductase
MFCYQCEQTAQGKGCDRFGVCGKDPETAALQDALLMLLKGIGWFGAGARAKAGGWHDREVDVFVVEGLFTTITNVDFGNFKLGTISGQKYEEKDGNGNKEADEPGLKN